VSGSPTITATLIVRHEEQLVGRCLESLRDVVDEIIVIHDGPCEDRTISIAASFGARTAELPLVGHSEHYAVTAYEWTTTPWILAIDADEFLSPELRRAIPELVRREDVNGYEFLWRMWDGQRYITERGPHKLSLFRRDALHMLGIIHAAEQVDPPIVRLDLQLEHQPLYNNWSIDSMVGKWRRWARVHARELLMPLEDVPTFNMPAPQRWTWRRKLLNALSPVLIVPYFLGTFAVTLRRGREVYSTRENVRFALYAAIYSTLVQLEVAKLLYVDRVRRR
jgi:glycosyltransferase involved in cell wall biosynthesis